MFRRKIRQDNQSGSQTVDHAAEVNRLVAQIAQLEHALIQVVQASDDLVVDLRRSQVERERASRTERPAFAEAWFRNDPPAGELEDFFTVSHVDKRARRWLLASN